MRYISLLFFITFMSIFADPFTYTIVEHPYRFSTYFDMVGKHGYLGRAIKNHISTRTTYDVFDANGTCEAQAIVQAFSLGSLFVWGKDMDIYDNAGKRIGFIDGQALTTARAKYSFYNQKNEIIGTAYLDFSSSGFVLLSEKEGKTLAHLRRNFIDHTTDHWDITIYEPAAIDLRLIKAFSAFAIDHQEYFKEDL